MFALHSITESKQPFYYLATRREACYTACVRSSLRSSRGDHPPVALAHLRRDGLRQNTIHHSPPDRQTASARPLPGGRFAFYPGASTHLLIDYNERACYTVREGFILKRAAPMTNYRNRIKALEYVNSADLVAHPGNWRDHPAAQAEALKGVLAEVGIAGALLAYRSDRQGGALVVIDGHLRKDAAPQQWPVLVLDVDDAEADYLLATHDP